MCTLLTIFVKQHVTTSPFSTVHQAISKFQTVSSYGRFKKQERKSFDYALGILGLVIPKTTGKSKEEDLRHHRLINSCMNDLLDGQLKGSMLQEASSTESSNPNIESDDSFLLFAELHKRRTIAEYTSFLSSVMRSCADTMALRKGIQLHALLIKFGCELSIPIGVSLIGLYSKCGLLSSAYRIFQMMPTKDTLSWTAIISGYAQNCQIEVCINLFVLMRQSMNKPNDFTFASLLGVCTGSAFLGLGKFVQCLAIRTGFDSYLHVCNALISMYAKCGSIDGARYMFETMPQRDLISFNSMIFGYAHYGLARHAMQLLEEMVRQGISPDSISFLGVLSSCRHACLVEEGRNCFNLMLEHGIEPLIDHYSCIVDLLGRAGLLDEAMDVIRKMPIPPNPVIWGSLLSSCRVHGNVWIGIFAAESRLVLKPDCAATYVQLANMYASVGCWSRVAKVRKLMKERGLKTSPGCSRIEIGNEVFGFKAEDRSDDQENDIFSVLDCLQGHMEFSITMNEDCELTDF